MSWNFTETGTIGPVITKLQEAFPTGNQTQIDVAKEFIISELRAIREHGCDSAIVEASGHHDDQGHRNVSIKISSTKILQ